MDLNDLRKMQRGALELRREIARVLMLDNEHFARSASEWAADERLAKHLRVYWNERATASAQKAQVHRTDLASIDAEIADLDAQEVQP